MDLAPGGICPPTTNSFHHFPVVTEVRLPEGLLDGQPECGDQRTRPPAFGGASIISLHGAVYAPPNRL